MSAPACLECHDTGDAHREERARYWALLERYANERIDPGYDPRGMEPPIEDCDACPRCHCGDRRLIDCEDGETCGPLCLPEIVIDLAHVRTFIGAFAALLFFGVIS